MNIKNKETINPVSPFKWKEKVRIDCIFITSKGYLNKYIKNLEDIQYPLLIMNKLNAIKIQKKGGNINDLLI